MLTISLRNIRTHPGRYLSTMVAIILGISFFVGTGVLTGTVRDNLSSAIGEAFTGVDTVVRSSDSIEFSGFEIHEQIPSELATQVAAVDGVATASPSLRGYAQLVGSDGKVLDGPAYATNWIEDDANPYVIVDGRPPTAPDEIVINTRSLESSNHSIGDQVRVLPLGADQPFTIVGTARYASDNALLDSENLIAFQYETATAVFGTTDAEFIVAQAEDGVSPEQLVQNINAANIGVDGSENLEAITGDEYGKEFQDLIGTVTNIISTALNIFAMIALAVGIFIIYNTFTILVVQRSREMALLRAIGSTGRQVRIAVIVESIIVGVVASLLGSLAGIGLGWAVLKLLGNIGLEISGALTIPAGTIVTGVIIGTLITVASAYLPARSASKVPPIAALRDVATGESAVSRARPMIGIAFAVVAVASVAASLTGGSPFWLVSAALSIIVGLLILGPTLVKPLSIILGSPLASARGMVGELAQQNAARSPKRTANTTAALMIGVLLVSAASVFASSLAASLESQLGEQVLADHLVTIDGSAAEAGGGLPLEFADRVAALDGVEAVTPLRNAFGEVDGGFTVFNGIDPTVADRLMDVEVLTGSLADLDATSIAALGDDYSVGDVVTVSFINGDADLTVAATYDAAELAGPWLLSTEVLETNLGQSLDTLLLIATDGSDSTIAAIDGVIADSPIASVSTKDEYVADQAGGIKILLNLLYGLLGISVLVAVVGIVNTMSLSIMERTREIGLLRAVGMTRSQIRSSIRYEASIVAIMGTVLGLVVGTFFAWLGVKAIGDALPEFVIPWTTLIVIAVMGIVVGIVAGILPAFRAAKLNVLDAIATE